MRKDGNKSEKKSNEMSAEVRSGGKEVLEADICSWSCSADLQEDFTGFQRWSDPPQPDQGDPEPGDGDPEPPLELSGAPRSSIVDRLLVELYEALGGGAGGGAGGGGRSGAESRDSSTEASGPETLWSRAGGAGGARLLQELQDRHSRRRQEDYLRSKAREELSAIVQEVRHRAALQSAKLLRQLRRRDRLIHKLHKNYDIVTACLQAVSQKRRVDTRLKFTIEPSLGKNGFQQWYDALKAVARLPTGIPKEWRKRVWLTLADQYLHSISIDWDKTLRFAFNERSNPDDDSLGIQIVKDLHRTGCSSYCGQEAEQDRVVLKRVLLAYARWNKTVGYCQGFNVLAALILEVTEGNESDALKVMIYLIDKVLPDSYFANNLRALSVDMAVFRDLLRLKLPRLSQHLHHLQKAANREAGGSYEPPLTNVFTMQWFLTMFATCLPAAAVLKIWDSVFFEGSEVLFRVALAIWERLGERIESCQTADEFYSTMGRLTQEMLENNLLQASDVMQEVYSMAVFPFPQLAELREKYTYNITPFPSSVRPSRGLGGWESDDDDAEMDDEDSVVTALGCLGPLGGLLAPEIQRYHRHLKDQRSDQANMAELSPGAVGGGAGLGGARAEHQAAINSMMMERMSTDIYALKKQYTRIKRRQQQQAMQLCIRSGPETATPSGILPEISNQSSDTSQPADDKCPATRVLPSQLNPSSSVINHLLLGRKELRPSSPSRGRGSAEEGASPWRAHVRQHRRNVARARAQLGFQDSEEREEEEPTGVEKGGEEEEGNVEEDEERKGASESSAPPSPDSSVCEEAERCPGTTEEEEEEEEEEEVVVQLESLDLEAESNPPNTDTPPQVPLLAPPPSSHKDSTPSTATPSSSPTPSLAPPSESRFQASTSANAPPSPPGSSPFYKATSTPSPPGSSPFYKTASPSTPSLSSTSPPPDRLRKIFPSSPSTPAALSSISSSSSSSPPQQQIFSPFPCVKPPRKSLAARNLGLYGPTARTPTVHFPHISRSSAAAATERR